MAVYTYFGAPGMGKTTYAVALAKKFQKKGKKVYSNFPIIGINQLDLESIGKEQYENCIMIIDEAGLAWSNRDFKSFPKHVMQWFKLSRHYGAEIYIFSQGWNDVDKKIRDLSMRYFNMKRVAWFTIVAEYGKKIGINELSGEIQDEYFRKSVLRGGVHICFRPRWYKYFDSWQAPALAPHTDTEW